MEREWPFGGLDEESLAGAYNLFCVFLSYSIRFAIFGVGLFLLFLCFCIHLGVEKALGVGITTVLRAAGF